MTRGELILQHFRGRADRIAVATDAGGFEPHECPEGIPAEWLDKQHLKGKQGYGFYLLDSDSRCLCSCIDIDHKPEHPNEQWREQAEKLYLELCSANLRPLVELSQSGNGVHIWILFSAPVDAWLVRAWWRGWQDRVDFKFREIFPKQDRLAGKGLGNLVRYPLWEKSCFVDIESDWTELKPQDVLRSVQKLDEGDLRLLAHQLRFGILEPQTVAVGTDDNSLPARVRKLIEKPWTLLGRRWIGDARGMTDCSPSAVCMAIARELVRCYVPTAETEAAVRYWLRHNDRSDKADRLDWIAATVAKAYDYMQQSTERASSGVSTFEDCCNAYIDQLERGDLIHVPSGLADLDKSIDGVALGEVCVIAARPSMGKSMFAFQWLDKAAALGQTCLLISEEMSASEIGKRRLQSFAHIEFDKWTAKRAPRLREDVKNYYDGCKSPYVVENCNHIDRVEQVIDEMCSVYGVDVVAVDYLQLLGGARGDRYEVVTEASRRIKQAAQRNKAAVLLLSQLNRSVEHRTGKDEGFKMSDLRESGQIEQDADLIMFLRWPHREDAKKYTDAGKFVIQVTKRRNGPIRCVHDGLSAGYVVARIDPYRQTIGGS